MSWLNACVEALLSRHPSQARNIGNTGAAPAEPARATDWRQMRTRGRPRGAGRKRRQARLGSHARGHARSKTGTDIAGQID